MLPMIPTVYVAPRGMLKDCRPATLLGIVTVLERSSGPSADNAKAALGAIRHNFRA